MVAVLFLVCDSTMVGVTAHAVTATRIAIRILRENIIERSGSGKAFREKLSGTASHGEKGATRRDALGITARHDARLEYTPGLGIFSRREFLSIRT